MIAASNFEYQQLKEITDDLLLLEHHGKLLAAATNLHSFFSAISGVDSGSNQTSDSEHIVLPSGKAICPKEAAICVIDYSRTAKFLRGIHAALIEARNRFPGEVIEVLYAGCGPFATLALPLATRFTADQIRFTLLDAHPRSLDSADCIVRACGLSDYVRDFIEADAASYVHDISPHVVITEAMQRALEKEPQVAITRNLAPQLRRGGILIPEQITVAACLCALDKEFLLLPADYQPTADSETSLKTTRVRINLGTVLELTAENARVIAGQTHLPPVVIDIPKQVDSSLRLMLQTTVRIFGDIVLDEYDSGITQPLILPVCGRADSATRVEFVYCLGSEPGFKYSFAHC